MLACGTILYFLANLQRAAIPGAVFDILQAELQVSAPYITAFGAVFMYVYAINQLATGLLVDRYGGRRVILAGGLFFCLGSVLFPLSHSLPMLYLSRALTGLGASAIYLSLIKETMRAFPGNYTIMISCVIMCGYAGGIMASAPLVAGVEAIGFRPLLLLLGATAVLFYVLFGLLNLTLKLPQINPVPLNLTPLKAVLQNQHNRDLCIFSGLNFGLYYVIQTVIGKKFLEDFCRLEASTAAWIISLLGVFSAVSGMSMAIISRLTGNRRQIFCRLAGWVCISVFAALTLLVFFELRTPWLAVLLCLFSLTASLSAITIPLLNETNPPHLTGSAVSLMNFTFFLAVAVFGNTVGFLLNIFPPELHGAVQVYTPKSYLTVFATLTIFAAISAKHALKMRETWGKNSSQS
ncbi:MAG: MFS transporter [Oligosphaeraceae bacterium]|nr:MFS transporter [Oligosphaeraceae bacterium]